MRMRTLLFVLPVLAASVAFAVPSGFAQTGGAGPTLTVVGFGLANLTPSSAVSPPQLELNFQTAAKSAGAALNALDGDIATVEKALERDGVPSSAIAPQGPPGLNFVSSASQANCEKVAKLKGVPLHCTGPGFQANEQLQVTFPSLTALAAALTKTDVAKLSGVQNFWINQGGSGPAAASSAALAAAYRQAFQNAAETAGLLAAADQLTLGAVVSVTEGAMLATPCGGMGCNPVPVQGVNPPQVGQNQELVAVTVSYSTTR